MTCTQKYKKCYVGTLNKEHSTRVHIFASLRNDHTDQCKSINTSGLEEQKPLPAEKLN